MMKISDANADEGADMLTKLLGVLGRGGGARRQTRVSMGSWCFLLVLRGDCPAQWTSCGNNKTLATWGSGDAHPPFLSATG